MAIKKAVATGLWSSTSTWDGGTLPTSADDVYSNTFIITIDQDIDVLSISNAVASGVTVGGRFEVSTTRNFASTNIISGTSTNPCLLIATNSITVTTLGSVTAGSYWGINVTAGSGTINIGGNVTAGATGQGSGINFANSYSGTLNVGGSIYGGSNGANAGVYYVTGNASNCNVTGSVFGSIGYGIFMGGSGNATILGDVTGATNFGIRWSSSGNCNITGSIIGGTGAVGYGVDLANATGKIYADKAIASAFCAAVNNPQTNINSVVSVRGTEMSSNFYQAVNGMVKYKAVADIYAKVTLTTGTFITLVDTSIGNPLASDVRDGVGFNGGFTIGTLKVPNPIDVSVGVATDDTVGTGLVKNADFYNNLVIINNGIKRESVLLPHTTNLIT